jgi:YidC/Oxa1 family membrane protein insertase
MEERRLLLAVALSLVVLTAYSLLFAPPKRPPSAPVRAAPGPAAVPIMEATPAPMAATPTAVPRPAVAIPLTADSRERRVEVLGPEYTVAFTNRGARLLSWTLGRYRDARGQPEEMVPASAGAVRPLDVETGDPALDARLRDALYQPSAEAVTVSGAEPQTLRFAFSDGEVEVEKTLVFRASGLVAVSVSVKRNGQAVPRRLLWGPGVSNPSPEERKVQGYYEPRGVALSAGVVEHLEAVKLPPAGKTLSGVGWVGVESPYFAALFVAPAGGAAAEVRPQASPARPDEKPSVAPVALVDANGPEPVQLFVGAKDHQAMAKLGHRLERVVAVGDWIGPIVVPLMGLLRWVQGHVGNWGWSIVVLTVLINVAMAPLRHYSIVNGLKMAKLSPEMKAIQERYRKVPLMDPRRQQMQEEQRALYARHGMSMGTQMTVGCLPLLLTMPFLIAFYRVLTISVDLRGAPFLWISDLARPDPLYLTPVLMGVSMFVMQKMTPSTMDPAQQRIMMLMPVMLAGMFLWAPAGLNLYWLTSNLWAILQQTVEMRILRPAGARPAARERAKR